LRWHIHCNVNKRRFGKNHINERRERVTGSMAVRNWNERYVVDSRASPKSGVGSKADGGIDEMHFYYPEIQLLSIY
jgi:hypothetical protein